MKKLAITLLISNILLIFISCEKEDEYLNIKGHTVIVYMLANNDLYKNALIDINEMETAWNNDFDGKLIVLLEPKSSEKDSYLIEITKDNNTESISSQTVTVYKGKDAINSQDMNSIINDIIQRYPSKRYSLILWSHGSGWLPANTLLTYSTRSTPIVELKSFGESDDIQMDIHDLAVGIPDNLFDIIIFDACHMGCIEVSYELKDKAHYIIASPTEILAQGFPYESIVPLFYSENAAVSIGKRFFDYYEQQDEPYRSATIGVVKTSELNSLAQKTKELISQYHVPQTFFNEVANIQYYDRYKNKIFYDFKQTIDYLCISNNVVPSSFYEQLEKTVLYSAHTERFINEFDIKNSCGLSCYIPNKNHALNIVDYYKNLKWYYESGFNVFFEE